MSDLISAAKQALEYLQDNQHHVADNERHVYVMEYNAFIEKLEQTIATEESSATQEHIQHCEAGKNYCQQCHDEDVNTPLDAAVRYIKNNTPKVVSDEICKALTYQQPKAEKQEPVAWMFRDDPKIYAMAGSGVHIGKEPPEDALDVIPLYTNQHPAQPKEQT
mgnify:CR=1 FL=1